MNVSEPENVSSFKTWLVDGGARIHPAVHFQPGSVSFRQHAAEDGDELRKDFM